MSIATLKKKAQTLYSTGNNFNTVSVRGVGFSLNGARRIVGVVGQTNLAKSVTRTPFRGNEPVGHGGGARCRVGGWRARVAKCAGTGEYPVNVCNSGSCATPQTLTKRSVVSTKGMLEVRYKGILHGTYPHVWVQPPPDNHSSVRTEKLSSEPFRCAGRPGKNWPCPSGNCGPTDAYAGGTFNKTGYLPPEDMCRYNVSRHKQYTKNLNLNARDYEQYLLKFKATCNVQPFPFPVNNGACSTTYATVEQAQQDGRFA